MDCSNIIQGKKSWGCIAHNGFGSKESAATSTIMELLSSVSGNQVENWETFHLRWINCLPKQKETPLILINGNTEMHKLIVQDEDEIDGACAPNTAGAALSKQPRLAAAPSEPSHDSWSTAWFPCCDFHSQKQDLGMIHNDVSKAIFEDAPDGTGWAEPTGPARLENHRRNLWHKQSPSHVPVPAQPSAGSDPVPSPTSEPPSMAQPRSPRAPQPRAGSREGWWLLSSFSGSGCMSLRTFFSLA